MVVKNLGAESSQNGILFAQFATFDAAKAWIAKK